MNVLDKRIRPISLEKKLMTKSGNSKEDLLPYSSSNKEDSPEQRLKGTEESRRKEYDFFLSVLSEVMPSDDDDDDLSCSTGSSAEARRIYNRRHQSLRSGPAGVPLQITIMDDSSDEEEEESESRLFREGSHHEIPEDPLPNFVNKVDALSQLSMSESVTSLPRSRNGGGLRRSNDSINFPRSSPLQPHRPQRSMSLGAGVTSSSLLVRESRSFRPPTRNTSTGADQSPRMPLRGLRIDVSNHGKRNDDEKEEEENKGGDL